MPYLSKFFSSLTLAAALMALIPNAHGQTAASMHRIAGAIDESNVVTLIGNVHPLARPEFDRGAVAPETRLERMVLVLAPSAAQQVELDALTKAQQEPGSALFHQWLSPAEYGARFGVSDSDLAQITNWLQGHGFIVEPVAAGRGLVIFSGTAGQVADTFHTEMHSYAVEGVEHIANAQDPQIPAALAEVVSGVLTLHDFRRQSAIHGMSAIARPEPGREQSATGQSAGPQNISPQNTQGSAHYLFPADYATIYNLNPLYTAGKNGAGTTLAIVGRSNITLSDVASFRSTAGLTANQPTVILDGANPGLVSGDQDESTLDVEWSGATAPNATVKFVVAASTSSTDGVDLSAQYIVTVASTSLRIVATGDGITGQSAVTVQVTPAPAITAVLSPASLSMASMSTGSVIVTVSPVGGVSLASSASAASFKVAGLPAGIAGSWTAPALTSTGILQAKLTLTGSTSAQASSTQPVITVTAPDLATGKVYTATKSMALTVSHVLPTLAITVAASKIAVITGQSETLQVTTTTGGSYAGLVTVGVTGLPTGVTASWNPATYTATGSHSAILTLKAASTAKLATTSLRITATGDGLTSTAATSVQVTAAPSILLPHSPRPIALSAVAGPVVPVR